MPNPVLLAVDDDPGVRGAIVRDLREHYDEDDTPADRQYEVLAADSGAAALDLVDRLRQRRQPIALVLSDERMPGMGGVDLLTKVRDASPHTKRVLLTAYADTDVAIRGVNRARLDLYLTKPWNPTELFSPLDDLLAAWRAEARHEDARTLLFGDRWSRECYQLREFLARNRAPYRYHDTASPEGREALTALVGDEWPALPLLVTQEGLRLERPDVQALATHLHLQTRAELERYDLVVVGAGPAGLTSSVYGASEGLRTLLLDRDAPGGQAGLSARIENYLGFPAGLSGRDLTTRAVAQARKFHVEIVSPQAVTAMRVEHEYKVLRLADGHEVQASAVVLAMGVQWRKITGVDGLDRFTGAGVYYGASMAEARTCRDETVYVVGGANSAGQAALNFAEFARKVVMLVRGPDLSATMSEYLIANIRQRDNIEVLTHTCVVGAEGDDRLRSLTLASPSGEGARTVEAASLYVMIGAAPDTDWLGDVVARDPRGYIYTGPDLPRPPGSTRPEGWPRSRDPWLLETCVPGVFAAGDVRCGSVKRVASSVGEGAVAIQFVHQYLAGK
ncbi:fused response regulator/thioredoxin-disulfide reductase [Luteitalea sp. TBR-22]|uniref:FAD-dependent oxidoreductase n=1 Tax=Luteitalea sp. TBR-22 TaxID=2802971 RepID=UPI001AFBC410|nr:FAD-dependent oxidoreductase [Luteitalea sp. TBR-22]BCS31145.1 fused response regulator/thioredoxin-disulfide reductase [Luteitalea sp. TBR-22]